MRKLNSAFKTAFISEAGAALENNDYFAFVELDDFACYVIASSITDMARSESAKTAVERILLRFQENPSIGKRALRSYLKEANEDLLQARGGERLKASVTVIATDYEAIRYASAGNARFRLYREGTFKAKSVDMSLSQDLVDEDALSPNLLTRHDERHNLYTYLGQEKEFRPFISAKFTLMDADVIVLYTRGIWENIDEADLDDIFSEAADDPQEPLDNTEDMLLSKQPDTLENYTIAAVFVDKVFTDPNRKRRMKRRIKIAVIVLIVLLIIGIIVWIVYSRHKDKVEEMNRRAADAVACMEDNNYIRAKDEAKKALDLAEKLKDKEKIARLGNYLRLIESVVAADDAYQAQKYSDAYEAFLTAVERSRYADNFGKKYIERRLTACQEHMTAADLIDMGDKLMEDGRLDKAEQRYTEAKAIAVRLRDAQGKQQAQEALDKLADEEKNRREEKEKKEKKKLADDLADLIGMGDTLAKGGAYDEAEAKYLAARELAAKNYDADGKKEALSALEKLHADKAKALEEAQKAALERAAEYTAAAELAAKGDEAFGAGDYGGASVYYNTALEKYTFLGDAGQNAVLGGKLQNVALKQEALARAEDEAAAAEERAAALYAQKEYASARTAYLEARQLYLALGDQAKADEIKTVLDQVDADAAIMETMPE